MFFRANAMFPLVAEELRAALDIASLIRVRNVAGRFARVSGEILLLGMVVPWLGRTVSFSFCFSFFFADFAA
jgi:hypothetical protein